MRVETFAALSILAIAVSILFLKEYGGTLTFYSEDSTVKKKDNSSEHYNSTNEFISFGGVENSTGINESYVLKYSNVSSSSTGNFAQSSLELSSPKILWSSNSSKNDWNRTAIEVKEDYNISQQISDIVSNATKIHNQGHKIPDTETNRDGKTTVIITSSLIPSHPSLWIINETISSVSSQLLGLEPDFKLIIGVDGLVKKKRNPNRARFRQYLRALASAFPNAQLVITRTYIGLSLNVKQCLQHVSTEFVYLLQHDMPFSRNQTINHTALIMASRDSKGVPFCVRFNKSPNWFSRVNRGPCFFDSTFMTYHEPTGLNFTKTAGWSDKYVIDSFLAFTFSIITLTDTPELC
jgi:hypothetical protein